MMGGSTKKSKEKGEKASELGASPFNSETVRIKIEFPTSNAEEEAQRQRHRDLRRWLAKDDRG